MSDLACSVRSYDPKKTTVVVLSIVLHLQCNTMLHLQCNTMQPIQPMPISMFDEHISASVIKR